MNYRRANTSGGTFFFTLVTHNRRPFLCTAENIALQRQAFRYAMSHHPFKIDAIVGGSNLETVLEEHFGCLPEHRVIIRKAQGVTCGCAKDTSAIATAIPPRLRT